MVDFAMGFADLDIKDEYRSKRDYIAQTFYYPILCEAVRYDRAVGFFSSTSLLALSDGLLPFINRGGTMRIIASPKLSEEDIIAIEKGYESKADIVEKAVYRELYEPSDFLEANRLNLIGKLIKDGRLDIRLAIMENYGMYHEKIGIFYDADDKKIAFTGSMNESNTAINSNYESFDTYCSWKTDYEYVRANKKAQIFDLLWENKEDSIEVLEFNNVKREIIQRYYKEEKAYSEYLESDINLYAREEKKQYGKPYLKPDLLFDYQKEAISKWIENDGVGIFDMATGTGKTYTGIGALCELFKKKGRLISIIVCPMTHLVEQWIDDLHEFNIDPIVAYGLYKYKDYPQKIRKAIFNFELGIKDFVCIICTKDTFKNDKLQNILERVKGDMLLMVDEAHNMGARSYVNKLTDRYKYRLALSATFERHADKEGTDLLFDFFGSKCIEYDLGRAINEGKLTPYKYYPILTYLYDDEFEQYKELSIEIRDNIIVDSNGERKLTKYGEKLAIDRARIVAGAKMKVDVLPQYIEKYKSDNHLLIYCGATTLDDDDFEKDVRQIDMISSLLGKKMGMKAAQFTSRESTGARMKLKEEFALGEDLQALVAIKCLDEGVNIPAIKTAFILASTTNPKEYIQRRGRVLRKAADKQYAEIYDFVCIPHDLNQVSYLSKEEIQYDYSLVKNELIRVLEFQRLADNSYDSEGIIKQMREAYGLYENEEVEYDEPRFEFE